MYIVFIVLILIASALIILAVLAQNPKGGMAANFGVSNQVMGVRQTTDFLERFTWILAIAILVLSVLATVFMPDAKIQASKDGIDKSIEQSVDVNMLPNQMAAPVGEVEPMDTPAEEAASEE